ncbi:MAG: glycosyltransferase family 39 protein [Alphaproteobacteria bacterium]|nr:glycosyltransferase family 39 protein [Alphaproteobacteria bacterium]
MKKNIKNYDILFWIILFVVVLTRLLFLDSIPAGINQDEAFAAYESFSLFTTGMDSIGNRFSVYFPTWGQGMSVLYGYLTVPFFALLGISTLTARLPQALFGILSCYLFFRLTTLMYNKRTGYIAFFLSAIMPWHIMMSRYGIEVNLAPFFILAGFYFFMKSYQKITFLLISALFYGLGVYAYDCCAIYIATSFAFQLFCRLWSNFSKKTFLFTILSGILFSLIVCPFVLLVAVNNNLIPEIRSFITIPKMHYWKQGNVNFSRFFQKLVSLWNIFYLGNDGRIQNVINKYGIFYPISFPFIITGLWMMIRNVYLKAENRRNNLILIGTLIIGILYAGMIRVSIHRVNFLWFNLILFLAIGINYLFVQKKDLIFIIGLYFCFFASFCWCYFTQYPTMSQNHFSTGLETSLKVALKAHETSKYPIYIYSSLTVYPKILFWNRVNPQEFRKTVKWENQQAKFLHAKAFSFYYIKKNLKNNEITPNAIYIVPQNKKNYFNNNFEITRKGKFVVAIPREGKITAESNLK